VSLRRKHLLPNVALVLMALAVGGKAPEAHAAACAYHTDAVFYNATDVGGRLPGELVKFVSPCVDYYITVMPMAGGIPRGGPAVTAIRAAGSNFHAMAEIRLFPWIPYATANGWYEAGIEVRRLMALAGYDAEDDTWALNEVGAPSSQAMGEEVFRNVGTARRDVSDFIRGLYTGDGTPMRGLVFAADPFQVTTDLSQYEQELASWYSDAPFWEDMGRYVRFWAQETYADARAWGVAGSTLAERTAYLNEYFMHGAVLAADGGNATKAASEFLARTYTPIGNAAMLQSAPELRATGIGFGFTQVPLNTMLNFVSTQTYALRSSRGDRFGFADLRGSASLSDVIAVEDRIAEAIRDSVSDPSGACGASGQWCDSSVPGAAFTTLWGEFGTPAPPTIVPHVDGPLGSDGWYTGDATVTWSVTDPVFRIWSTSGCEDSVIVSDTAGTTLTCSATSYGGTASVDVTVKRDATAPAVSCEPTPSTLWPPNRRLVPVAVAVTVTDATSGPGTFALTEASSSDGGAESDVVGFVTGTPDVEGLLRAERLGTASGRVYRLTYVAHDAAGNEARCVATVVVPHDQGD
jgi:hypothetical protein